MEIDKKLAKAEIVKVLKEQGLEVTEEMVVIAIKASVAMTRKIIELTPNKWDDLALPLITPLEKLLLGFADQINTEDNEGL